MVHLYLAWYSKWHIRAYLLNKYTYSWNKAKQANHGFVKVLWASLHMTYHYYKLKVFHASALKDAKGIMFGVVRPSVPLSVHLSVRRLSICERFSLLRYLKSSLMDFDHTWLRGTPCHTDTLRRFWARFTWVQRSKLNELYLKSYFYQLLQLGVRIEIW